MTCFTVRTHNETYYKVFRSQGTGGRGDAGPGVGSAPSLTQGALSAPQYDFMERLDGKEKWSVVESPRERRSIQTLVQNEAVFVQYLDVGLWHLAFYNDGKDKEMVSFNTVVLGRCGVSGMQCTKGRRASLQKMCLPRVPTRCGLTGTSIRFITCDVQVTCVTSSPNQALMRHACCWNHAKGTPSPRGRVKSLGQTSWVKDVHTTQANRCNE